MIKKPSKVFRNQLAFFGVLSVGFTSFYASSDTTIDGILSYSLLAIILTTIALGIFSKHRKKVALISALLFVGFGGYTYQNPESIKDILILLVAGAGIALIGYILVHLRGQEKEGRLARRIWATIGMIFAFLLFLGELTGIVVAIGVLGFIVLIFNLEADRKSGGGSSSGGSSWSGCGGCGSSDGGSGCSSGCGSGCGGCGGCGG